MCCKVKFLFRLDWIKPVPLSIELVQRLGDSTLIVGSRLIFWRDRSQHCDDFQRLIVEMFVLVQVALDAPQCARPSR